MNRTVSNSLIYVGVTVLQASVNFLLLPVYTRFLSTEQYGIISVVEAIANFLGMLYGLSLRAAVIRFHHKYVEDPEKVARIWGSSVVLVFITSFALSTFFVLTRRFILGPFLGNISFFPYMMIGLFTVSLNPIYQMFQASLQTRQAGPRYGINALLFFVLEVGLTLILVVVVRLRAEGVLVATAATNLVFFVWTIIRFSPDLRLGLWWKELREALGYSLPLLPHALAVWTLAMIDKILINRMVGTASAGIYDVGSQIGGLVNILVYSVNLAVSPWCFAEWRRGDLGRKRIADLAGILVCLYGFVGLAVGLFSAEGLSIVATRSFGEAWKIAPIIALAYTFNGVYSTTGIALYVDKTYIIPILTVATAVVKVCLSLILIRQFGIVGAAVATMGAMIFMSMLVYVVSQRVEKVPYKPLMTFGIPLIAGVLSLSAEFFRPLYASLGIWAEALKAGVLLVFLLVVWSLVGRKAIAWLRDRVVVAAVEPPPSANG